MGVMGWLAGVDYGLEMEGERGGYTALGERRRGKCA